MSSCVITEPDSTVIGDNENNREIVHNSKYEFTSNPLCLVTSSGIPYEESESSIELDSSDLRIRIPQSRRNLRDLKKLARESRKLHLRSQISFFLERFHPDHLDEEIVNRLRHVNISIPSRDEKKTGNPGYVIKKRLRKTEEDSTPVNDVNLIPPPPPGDPPKHLLQPQPKFSVNG